MIRVPEPGARRDSRKPTLSEQATQGRISRLLKQTAEVLQRGSGHHGGVCVQLLSEDLPAEPGAVVPGILWHVVCPPVPP